MLDNGRPSVPPSLLATALVLQTYDRVSDDEAKRRADYDLQWKVALGVELDRRPFAKSTLQEFRAQLVLHDQQRAIFQRSLELAKRRGKLNPGRKLKVALDTTNILGRGAVKDTYNLLADGIRLLARALARLAGEPLKAWAERQGLARYVTAASLKGSVTIDWNEAAQRRRFLAEIVADADRLLELARQARGTVEADSVADRALAEAAGLLSRVLVQDIERREDGPALMDGVAPERLVSVHDPEQRHGRKSKSKRFDGHKVQVATDTDSQLITGVEVMPGNAADAGQALAVVEQSEAATGCSVDESLGDCAYGGGTTRQAFADAERKLIAKVPSVSNQGYFPKTAFSLDLEALSCRCPAGQTTHDLKPFKGGGGQFQFATGVCAGCPLRAACVRGSGGRSVQLHPQERLLQAARELQASPAFLEYRTRRQVVEHRIARLMQLGLRQARYVGLAKTLFQACMAAAVANLTLLVGEPATAAQAGALVAASLAFVWAVLEYAEGSPAPGRGAPQAAGVNRAAPDSRPWSPPFAGWQLGAPAGLFKLATSRPGF